MYKPPLQRYLSPAKNLSKINKILDEECAWKKNKLANKIKKSWIPERIKLGTEILITEIHNELKKRL